MSENNKVLVRTLFEDADRTEALNYELVTPDFTANVAGNPPMDAEAFEQFLMVFYNAFSNFSHTFQDILAEDDKVVFRVMARATHTGDFMGVAATGRNVTVGQIGMARIVDGRISEVWNSPDQVALMQQIGMIPQQ